MRADRDHDRNWRLYARATDFVAGTRNGHALPILRVLAARGFPPAQNHLADFVNSRTALRLLRRAAAGGDAMSLYNLAIEHRNRGDLRRYRHWLARAARVDPEARDELRRFRIRFPEHCMKRWRRYAAER